MRIGTIVAALRALSLVRLSQAFVGSSIGSSSLRVRPTLTTPPRRMVSSGEFRTTMESSDIILPEFVPVETSMETTLPEEFSLQSVELELPKVASGEQGLSLEEPSLPFGRALVLGAAAIYGTNFCAVKMLDEKMPMSLSASLRFSMAAVVVAALVLAREEPLSSTTSKEHQARWDATLAGAQVGAWYCGGYIFQALGLQTADASKSAFFNALAVIVVPLLDAIFRGKTLSGTKLGSVALAIAGVGLLEMGPHLLGETALGGGALQGVTPGDLFCLGQAFFFGVGYWMLESVSTKFPEQAPRITVGQLAAIALGSILYFLGTEDMPSFHAVQHWLTDDFIVKALLWTGLVSTALALYLETVALKVVSASELTVLMTSVSLWGSAFAYMTMGEVLDPVGWMGGLAILAGCVLSSLGASLPAASDVEPSESSS